MKMPAFGYTYRLNGYPMASPPWYDKSNDSYLFPVTSEETPVIHIKDAAFLWTSVVS